jgi:hypothetical protein
VDAAQPGPATTNQVVTIKSFQVKDVNRVVAFNRLLGLPEVQALASSMNLKMRPPNAPSARFKDEKLSFDLSGVTLRQALNRIAADSGGRFWVFRRYPDGTFEFSLSCCDYYAGKDDRWLKN